MSIQNGRAIWRLISSDSASSRIEKNGFGPGGGQVRARQDVDVEAQPVAGERVERLAVPVLRIGLVDVDESRDVGRHGGGQALRHELPMPLHEDIGDDRLQQDDRRDDDDQRAGVEALRHQAAKPAREAADRAAFGGASEDRTGPHQSTSSR